MESENQPGSHPLGDDPMQGGKSGIMQEERKSSLEDIDHLFESHLTLVEKLT